MASDKMRPNNLLSYVINIGTFENKINFVIVDFKDF